MYVCLIIKLIDIECYSYVAQTRDRICHRPWHTVGPIRRVIRSVIRRVNRVIRRVIRSVIRSVIRRVNRVIRRVIRSVIRRVNRVIRRVIRQGVRMSYEILSYVMSEGPPFTSYVKSYHSDLNGQECHSVVIRRYDSTYDKQKNCQT